MIALDLDELAAAVGGELVLPPGRDTPGAVSGSVTVDSRAVGAGDLFVALPGERADGADFVPAAAAAGAAAALTTRPDPLLACVVVADPVYALGRLAAAVHERLVTAGLLTVGITGSSGKTSTKDLLGQVLAAAGPTVSPQGSFNNDIGLPLTVLTADTRTRFLVLEMGSRGPGHIARLCAIARPQVGVVLNVGSAHLGEFGSAEVIAASKGELVEALPAGGTAVLNADDPRVAGMAPRTRARVVTTGVTTTTADVRALDVELDEAARARFTLAAAGEEHPVTLQVVGAHQVANALSAAAAALAAGLAPAQVAEALSAAGPRSRWRMEVTRRADGVTVVNDAYNANPESMGAALAALAGLAGQRRIAVLGAMGELGPGADAAHAKLGRDAVRAGVDVLVSVGPDAIGVHTGALAEGSADGGADAGHDLGRAVHVADRAAAGRLLAGLLAPGDVVLVKASRSYGLELLAAQLVDPDLLADGTTGSTGKGTA
ncbi:UDP-N-acetylmuramoyl-tripeptide--D-alanyl-D-alanine ligase [Modestobacter sp. DSM 44400]|uniref:UDP-N-acetylmuramoyl-tripeptide--D-alanyl-D- alanine ligase n=1 Tax=Modestobacter sp. DSM 44400 TaxID=1550230 RepID=UPI00089C43FE|nr:UDP-N-acetylmuramoyl-tripeptide--D-alanyl-D-alanine ligase [Modestobacter sp. DSM 44400]SDX95489.1 UDP-N-acetylmuramoyl-tripeptide--D-alanyl-D-alanine ligase [Modestobacter sp. DSM 44400]